MVKFVAKTLAVDNSDLSVLDGYEPIGSLGAASIGIESQFKSKNGTLWVKVTENDTFWFKISKIETTKKKADKLFEGDWEPKMFNGDDTIKGSTEADMLYGFKGNDVIKGNAGDDWIYGGAGKDFLDGGAGFNYLTGGGGKDIFAFSVELMGGNYSEITDFQEGKDKFQLSKSAFEGVGKKGTLKSGKFFLESEYTGKAKSVIYDEASGTLKYSKGGGDIGNAIAFGRVEIGTDLSHKDFLIV